MHVVRLQIQVIINFPRKKRKFPLKIARENCVRYWWYDARLCAFWCGCWRRCWCYDAVLAQTSKEARVSGPSGYSGTTVVLAGVMSAVIVFLTAGVVALVVRQLHRRQQGKRPERAEPVAIGQVTAPGFETVRSKCSVGPESIDEDNEEQSTA